MAGAEICLSPTSHAAPCYRGRETLQRRLAIMVDRWIHSPLLILKLLRLQTAPAVPGRDGRGGWVPYLLPAAPGRRARLPRMAGAPAAATTLIPRREGRGEKGPGWPPLHRHPGHPGRGGQGRAACRPGQIRTWDPGIPGKFDARAQLSLI